MFTQIKSKLDKKLSSINQDIGLQERINKGIQSFLIAKGYPQVHISYDRTEGQVRIETPSKVFANELSLHLEDIAKILTQSGIKPKSIVIR